MSRRPVPTQTVSLFDFAGSGALDRLQKVDEITNARRQKARRAAAASEAAVGGDVDTHFASRMDTSMMFRGPRRVFGLRQQRTPVAKVDTTQEDQATEKDETLEFCIRISPKAGEQRLQQVEEQRRRARDFASASQNDSDVEDAPEVREREREQLKKAFASYGNKAHGEEMQRLEQWTSQKRSCSICIESIKAQDRIWSCQQCFVPIHLACIQSWASKLINFAQGQNMKNTEPWYCPNCRSSFKRNDYPKDYLCFCGKEIEPRSDPWILAHSCGEVCGKKLPCGHSCTLLCHPGRCPPCPRTKPISCYCGANKENMRCGSAKWGCESKCDKLLACGKHKCPRTCHGDDCGPCETRVVAPCKCGKKKKLLMCHQSSEFQCDAPCGKLKPCGVHYCDDVCHSGECPPCPTKKTCPCGKTTVPTDCRDPDNAKPPRCDHTCGKLLDCGKHRCTRRCHTGPCQPCMQVSTKTCRCSKITKEVRCSEELLCDRKCTKDRGCGRHKCQRRCCDGNCPPCAQTCDRKLDCGHCKCTLVCGHGGFDSLGAEVYSCPPCNKQNEVHCLCRETVLAIPCGLPRKPPPCRRQCVVPPTCHHSSRQPHRCHFGGCPPCTQICDLQLPCGHKCISPCHDPVPNLDLSVAVMSRFRDKPLASALAELVPKGISIDEVKCPPCTVAVKRQCLGQHKVHDRKCHESPWFSCDEPCGNLLPCGNHRCQSKCHSVTMKLTLEDFEKMMRGEQEELNITYFNQKKEEGGSPSSMSKLVAQTSYPSNWPDPPEAQDCRECGLPCMRPRPCKHACPWPCHYEPCPPCFEEVHVRCHCTQSLLAYACCEVMSWPDVGEEENPFLRCPLVCHKPRSSCPHLCPQKCHFGPCPPCEKEVAVKCRCGNIKRQLPCSEVWINNKKLVLPCEEDCPKDAPPEPPEEELAPVEQKVTPKHRKDDFEHEGGLRERKKEKAKRLAEEREEQKFREEAEKLRRQRIRCGVMTTIAVLVIILLGSAIYLMRLKSDEEAKKLEREMLKRRGW